MRHFPIENVSRETSASVSDQRHESTFPLTETRKFLSYDGLKTRHLLTAFTENERERISDHCSVPCIRDDKQRENPSTACN